MQNLVIAIRLISALVYVTLCDRSKKIHIDYDVRGVASIRAIDKLEVRQEGDVVFYRNRLTSALVERNYKYLESKGFVYSAESFTDTTVAGSVKQAGAK